MKRGFKIILLISIGIIILLFLFILISMVDVNRKIVEDKLLLSLICKLRYKCSVLEDTVSSCVGIDSLTQKEKDKLEWHEDQIKYELIHWDGYKGCNSSTKGYIEQNGGAIIVNKCNCQNIISIG